MKPIILTLFLVLSVQVQASPKLEFLMDLYVIERANGLPPGMMEAVWAQECSLRVDCPRGKHLEWGPFQIKEIRARSAGCLPGWKLRLGNAVCAVRILAQELQRCGTITGAFSRYHRPADGCRKPKAYAMRVMSDAEDMGEDGSKPRYSTSEEVRGMVIETNFAWSVRVLEVGGWSFFMASTKTGVSIPAVFRTREGAREYHREMKDMLYPDKFPMKVVRVYIAVAEQKDSNA